MPRQIHLFDRPARFIAGTVGMPGERTFFLQAVDGPRIVSVALEKQQVSVLAERLEQLLGEIAERTGAAIGQAAADTAALSVPIEEEFRVEAMALAWDGTTNLVIIEAQGPTDGESPQDTLLEDVEDGPDALRVMIEPESAQAFIDRAKSLLAAGRPPCPLCSLPLSPDGHVCPRQNGYHRAMFSP